MGPYPIHGWVPFPLRVPSQEVKVNGDDSLENGNGELSNSPLTSLWVVLLLVYGKSGPVLIAPRL